MDNHSNSNSRGVLQYAPTVIITKADIISYLKSCGLPKKTHSLATYNYGKKLLINKYADKFEYQEGLIIRTLCNYVGV